MLNGKVGSGILAMLVAGGLLAVAPTVACGSLVAAQPAGEELDVITFRDGKVVKGEILEETATSIRIRVVSYGIEAVTTYDRADVLAIKKVDRTQKKDATREEVKKDDGKVGERTPRERAVSEATNRVYHIRLDGRFGKEITQSPLREALEDAAKNNANYVVIEIENEWKANEFEDLPDDAAAFDQLFRAEAMHPLLNPNGELLQIYGGKELPTIVFWVKKAMGGAAFLPLVCPNIYFAENGKMGGIGNFGDLFGSTGDEVVRDKQRSLRMGHAKGAALLGGYPGELVEAMADRRKVYSYRVVGGRVELKNDWPDVGGGWTLLTDDGEGANADTIQQLARSEGNDTLTLDAKLAQTLQVSKGTVNSLDALLFALGLSRNATVIEGQSEKIMDGWEKGLASAERRLVDLWREYNEIQVGGQDARERNAARGRQIRKLEDMIKLIRRYEEAIVPGQLRIPGEPDLRIIIERIRLEMMRDR